MGCESWRAAYEVSVVTLRMEGALSAEPSYALTSEALYACPGSLGLGANVVTEVSAAEASHKSREPTLRGCTWMFAMATVCLNDLAVAVGRLDG